MAAPIQIVLNPENFHTLRDGGGGGGNTDFFGERDDDFAAHKARLTKQINSAAQALLNSNSTTIGYLKVVLRRKAWAKSHRPLFSLFKATRTPLAGGEDLGVMIVEANPESLLKISTKIGEAEPETRWKFNEITSKDEYHPSRLRSEVGAIERVELYGPTDRRDFSIEDAVVWLSQANTGSAYVVELFETPPPRNRWDAFDDNKRRLFASFIDGIAANQKGLAIQLLRKYNATGSLVTIRVEKSNKASAVVLTQSGRERQAPVPFDSDISRHRTLLEFLDSHPLVRSISLSPFIVASNLLRPSRAAKPSRLDLPMKDSSRSYPSMGIIDGGISGVLDDWVVDRWDLLASDDTDLSHGTFIGGLAVAGKHLNTEHCCGDADGMNLFDLAVFPSDRSAFSDYYPEGIPQFFDEVETAIDDARSQHGVRIFNLSLNIVQPVQPHRYSSHALRLDQIADTHDALLFISAGNLSEQDLRPEWPSNTVTALMHLASSRNDGILMPAESVRNVAVAAVNPIGDLSKVDFAPARYSRRGPGLRVGNKPDLAHVGGYGSTGGQLGHGLFSVSPDGAIVDGCGTSYAAPMVAKTAAALDHAIEGNVSRETLIALLVHHASRPEPLQDKSLSGAARQLVGFGVPPPAHEILNTESNEITIVIATRIKPKQSINFSFAWPKSLVSKNGKCRGYAKLTIVASPPLDQRFGAEFVRINIAGALQQEQANGGWKGKLDPIYLPDGSEGAKIEAELIEQGFKWGPVKVYDKLMPLGVGQSSNWRLAIDYLERAGEDMPEEGVPFTAILTISDPKGKAPVFDEMRQTLSAIGVKIADIRTAARITPRV